MINLFNLYYKTLEGKYETIKDFVPKHQQLQTK